MYKRQIQLIKEGKRIGATTILGNDHASFHSFNLLKQVDEIDFISTQDIGEESLLKILEHLNGDILINDIPSVTYKSKKTGEIITNKKFDKNFTGRFCLDELPIPNRKLLDKKYWDYYLKQFKKQKHYSFDVNDVTGVSTINRARGCCLLYTSPSPRD